MKKILMDTNAFTRLFTGDQAVLEALACADTVYLSVFVLGELYAGFIGGSRETENRNLLQRFMEKSTVQLLVATQETASIFAYVKHQLKKSGQPIPINDVWIAAHTLETGSVLITFDRHFSNVQGLRISSNV
jgi:tRNA(fMet)-specific endonuclease VapC